MFLPPDQPTPPSYPPARAFVRRLGRLARAATWHALHPSQRQRFVERTRLRPMQRLYAETSDGWQLPIFHQPAPSSGSGEPVLLCAGLGLGPQLFRLGPSGGLAEALHRQGYAVYFLTHRGSAESIAPVGPRRMDVDHIWSHDIPSVLAEIRAHSGFSRVHWIGHGFGGQLGLGYAALYSSHGLATLVTLGASVQFSTTKSYARLLKAVVRRMPAREVLPNRVLSRWLSLWVDGTTVLPVIPSQRVGGSWVRTVLNEATENTPIGMVKDVMSWMDRGEMTAGRGLVSIPALMSDITCPGLRFDATPNEPDWLWGHEDTTRVHPCFTMEEWDYLLANEADAEVNVPLIEWLERRRRLVWVP